MSDSNTDDGINREELLILITQNEEPFKKAAEDSPDQYEIVQAIRRIMAENKSVLALTAKGDKHFVKYFDSEYQGNKRIWRIITQDFYPSCYYVLRIKDCRFFYKDDNGELKDVWEPVEETETETETEESESKGDNTNE